MDFVYSQKFKALTVIAFIAFFLFSGRANGQYYNIGTDAASVKWNSVGSKNFTVIYPQDKSSEKINYKRAARYLDIMEGRYGIHSDSVLFNYGLSSRFPLVLHTRNAASNGMTVWAPRQIDLFGVPTPDILYPQNWDTQLALHEGRHAWQIAHFNRGFFKVLYWFFGDQFTGGASGIYPSRWLLEGDAVVAETEMSKTGRGRSGEFINSIIRTSRTQDNRKLTWDRLRLGSVKHYNLGPYSLGYAINAMARHNSGDYDLTHKILNYEPMHFMSANVLASAFEDFSGKSHRDYVNNEGLAEFIKLNTNKKLDEFIRTRHPELTSADAPDIAGSIRRFGVTHGYYTELSSIQVLGKDSVIALINGYGSTPCIALLIYDATGGRFTVKNIRTMSSGVNRITVHEGHVLWSELVRDVRWEGVTRSYIFALNIKSGKVRRLDLSGENLYRPTVYGKKLYTVEYKSDSESSFINVYDLEAALNCNGKTLASENSVECKGQVTEIAVDGESLYYTMIENEGLSLHKISDFHGNKHSAVQMKNIMTEQVAESEYCSVRELSAVNGNLFFITDYFGGQRLCKYLPKTRDITIVAVGDDIKSYCINGYDSTAMTAYISEFENSGGTFVRKKDLLDIVVDSSYKFRYPLADELSRQFSDRQKEIKGDNTKALEFADNAFIENLSSNVPQLAAKYNEKWYSKTGHLFKIHSWAPFYADISGASSANTDEMYVEGKLGATIYSQNNLGTTRAMVGYSYERPEFVGNGRKNLHGAHAKFSYSGWYPVLEVGAHFNDEEMYDTDKHSFRAYASAYIPFQFNSSGWLRGITPQIMWDYRNDEEIIVPIEDSPGNYMLSQTDRNRITGALGAYCTLPTSQAGIYPRLGIGGVVTAGFNPAGGENFGSIYSGRLYGYIPGIGFNQSVRLTAGYQFQDIDGHKYWLDNLLALPRGYTEDMYGKHYFKASVDYAIPIYLGDVSLGCFAYLKRLDVIPFVDFAKMRQIKVDPNSSYDGTTLNTVTKWSDVSSYGADVVLNAHFFRIGFPVAVGVRYARRNDVSDAYGRSIYDNKDYFGLILTFNFR